MGLEGLKDYILSLERCQIWGAALRSVVKTGDINSIGATLWFRKIMHLLLLEGWDPIQGGRRFNQGRTQDEAGVRFCFIWGW